MRPRRIRCPEQLGSSTVGTQRCCRDSSTRMSLDPRRVRSVSLADYLKDRDRGSEVLISRAADNLDGALSAGVTTVRDCGTLNAVVFAVRSAIESGELKGPRVLTCGSPLTTNGGHCYFFGLSGQRHARFEHSATLARISCIRSRSLRRGSAPRGRHLLDLLHHRGISSSHGWTNDDSAVGDLLHCARVSYALRSRVSKKQCSIVSTPAATALAMFRVTAAEGIRARRQVAAGLVTILMKSPTPPRA